MSDYVFSAHSKGCIKLYPLGRFDQARTVFERGETERGRQTDRYVDRHTNTQRQTDRQKDRQVDRQTKNRQKEGEKEVKSKRETEG